MGILDGYRTPYEALKAYQQAVRSERGRKTRLRDLVVLTPQKDPYHIGTPAQQEQAEWFTGLFGERSGVHLRRLHYMLVARGDVLRTDGRLYENDTNSWQYLQAASRYARYLGQVNPEDIIDMRNPTPHLYMVPGLGIGPQWDYELETNALSRISSTLSNHWFSPLLESTTNVEGYVYEEALQPYLVEVWAEKTTMDDILRPLCSRLGANYVSGAGYQSITAAVSLLKRRVGRLGNPTRILYVSDYDSAGQNMPKQMGRQVEFWSERYRYDYDIRLEPIVLTAEQAAEYPAAPDTGAVELDAMEAFDPGKLEQVVHQGVAQFRDFDLGEKVGRAEGEAEDLVEEATREAISEELESVEALKVEVEEIYGRYRPRLRELAAELDAELAPLNERLETYQQAAMEKLEALEVALPGVPMGETEEDPEDEGWLFDSRRNYAEQLVHYKGR